MSYQTGSANGPHDLLAAIRSFAISDSWTVNRYSTTLPERNELCISKGDMYYNLASFENADGVYINGFQSNDVYALMMNGSDGYSAGADWDRQPGYSFHVSQTTSTNQRHCFVFGQGGYPSYHLFSPNLECIYLELEERPSVHQRLGFGRFVDEGGVTGGYGDLSTAGTARFFYASTGSSYYPPFGYTNDTNTENNIYALEHVPFRAASFTNNNGGYYNGNGSYARVIRGGFDNWAQSARSNNTVTECATGGACQGGVHEDIIWNVGNNPLNGQGILTPITVSWNEGNQFLMPIGVMDGFRYIDISLYQPGEEFSLGTDIWKVFPWWQKGGISGQRGIAYKRVD